MSHEPIVLYAEDDENDAFFMQRAFAKLKRPQALRVVPTGQHAIAYLSGTGDFADRARHPLPAIVMLDVKMPGMSGLETLAWIRARPEFDALPILMFTSSTQASDVEKSRTFGANAYLVKPSNAERLDRLVSQVLEQTLALPPRHPGDKLAIEGNQI